VILGVGGGAPSGVPDGVASILGVDGGDEKKDGGAWWLSESRTLSWLSERLGACLGIARIQAIFAAVNLKNSPVDSKRGDEIIAQEHMSTELPPNYYQHSF
jgi:hypothetical protein